MPVMRSLWQTHTRRKSDVDEGGLANKLRSDIAMEQETAKGAAGVFGFLSRMTSQI